MRGNKKLGMRGRVPSFFFSFLFLLLFFPPFPPPSPALRGGSQKDTFARISFARVYCRPAAGGREKVQKVGPPKGPFVKKCLF